MLALRFQINRIYVSDPGFMYRSKIDVLLSNRYGSFSLKYSQVFLCFALLPFFASSDLTNIFCFITLTIFSNVPFLYPETCYFQELHLMNELPNEPSYVCSFSLSVLLWKSTKVTTSLPPSEIEYEINMKLIVEELMRICFLSVVWQWPRTTCACT